jgi:hypothetical protein
MDDQRNEYITLLYDISKHLTTVGTVTAVVMVALSEGRGAPYVPLLLLAVSVSLALGAMGELVRQMSIRSGRIGPRWVGHDSLLTGSAVALVAAVVWYAVGTFV